MDSTTNQRVGVEDDDYRNSPNTKPSNLINTIKNTISSLMPNSSTKQSIDS